MNDTAVVGEDGEWEFLQDDWWHISFNAVSWTYPSSLRPRRRVSVQSLPVSSPSRSFKPIPTRDTLLRSSPYAKSMSLCCGECQELRHSLCPCQSDADVGVDLRADLVGVTLAEDALGAYEACVGFGTPRTDSEEMSVVERTRRVLRLRRHAGADALGDAKDTWRSHICALFPDAFLSDRVTSASSPPTDAAALPSILDLDLGPESLRSDPEALPSTPRPSRRVASTIKEQVDHVLRKFERLQSDWRDDDGKHPSREPSSPSTTSSSPATSDDSQSLASFTTTRTRSSSLPSVNLRKDEHGFYNLVEEDHSDPFLGNRLLRGRKSAVKEHAFDQSSDADDDDARRSFSVKRLFQCTGDGWIRVVENTGDEASTPRSPSPPDDVDADEQWPSLASAASKPAPPPTHMSKHARRASSSADCWVDRAPVATFSGQRKQRSRSQQFAPRGAPFGFPLHPPPPPPPHPGFFMYPPPPPPPQGFVPMPYTTYPPYAVAPPAPALAPYGPYNMSPAPAFHPTGWL
ncbi:hypothetical protein K488DRAFT_82920 [Vararia minispora EC-137]|uniref:Uncharacterized protein n=1 Tax=Vararia minispora EC-137 TaxID=1314806 RepID=A0ACB8QVR6_9AGAM|nr:hypothetical protein K488DRAFT_82920 [Vararia minispora EC-137]